MPYHWIASGSLADSSENHNNFFDKNVAEIILEYKSTLLEYLTLVSQSPRDDEHFDTKFDLNSYDMRDGRAPLPETR